MSTEIEAGAQVTIANKNEKKAIKALKGTGCKKVEGIERVLLRKRIGPALVIVNPEVYRTPNGSYVVIGEAKPQEAQPDLSQQLSELQTEDKSPEAIQADLAASADAPAEKEEEPEVPDDQVDTTGIDEETLTMVMEQANVSKSKAVNALRANKNDVVNALMALTS